jgi:hypothetical protein
MVKAIRLMQEKAQQSAMLNDEDPDEDEDDDESQSHETDASEAESIVNEDMDFENAEQDAGQSLSDNEVDDDSDEILDTEHENQFDLPVQVPYLRMPCMAHTLQLIIKLAYVHYDAVLSKTRRLVAKLRKSSVAVEKLMKKCGKSVVTDCTTRWNSTYQMIKRLLVIKNDINYVLSEMGKYNRLFHQLLT